MPPIERSRTTTKNAPPVAGLFVARLLAEPSTTFRDTIGSMRRTRSRVALPSIAAVFVARIHCVLNELYNLRSLLLRDIPEKSGEVVCDLCEIQPEGTYRAGRKDSRSRHLNVEFHTPVLILIKI